MSNDEELEFLKRKRLLEMQKRFLVEKAAEQHQEKKVEKKAKEPKEVLKTIFAESAWKIWQAAEQQYPKAAEEVAKGMVALAEAGKIREKVTGEQLYSLFSELGFSIRIETKIRILEKGEFKTIADKLREK